ncbi:hypothetical protein Mgra_00005679 [Meloidogyne graminicola]|uniref:Uncharacterized protein n=1 Tax=Meloidogyne graminicola TaxID=189291 RepID=A0A8S9ZND7_9BILA|nr:hypothetical protein Mgra_00005679 [Meloidogyne graminicola]
MNFFNLKVRLQLRNMLNGVQHGATSALLAHAMRTVDYIFSTGRLLERQGFAPQDRRLQLHVHHRKEQVRQHERKEPCDFRSMYTRIKEP